MTIFIMNQDLSLYWAHNIAYFINKYTLYTPYNINSGLFWLVKQFYHIYTKSSKQIKWQC